MSKGEDGRRGGGADRKGGGTRKGGDEAGTAGRKAAAGGRPRSTTGGASKAGAAKTGAAKAGAARGGAPKAAAARSEAAAGGARKPKSAPRKPAAGNTLPSLRGPVRPSTAAEPGPLTRFGTALLARRRFLGYGLVGIAVLVVAGAVIGSLIKPARYEQVARPTLPAGAAVTETARPEAQAAPAVPASGPEAPRKEWTPDLAGSGDTITGADASRESQPQAAATASPAPVASASAKPPSPTATPKPSPVKPAEAPAAAVPERGPQQLAAIQPPVPDAIRPPADGKPAWQRYAVPAPAAPRGPRVAIVIDDMGVNKPQTAAAIGLPSPITFAFLPYAQDVAGQAAKARAAGHELIVHMPMQPQGAADPGPGALNPALSVAENVKRLKHNLDAFSAYVGINNHMGSRATEDTPLMAAVMAELKARGLMFLDSRTTAKSVGSKAAISAGIPNAQRDVFLDHEIDERKIAAQLDRLEAIARRHGAAIAIGHPHPETLRALNRWLPAARARGVVFVPLTALVAVPGASEPAGPRTVSDEAAPARAEEGPVFADGPAVKE
ncbi:divergent polysaccharide deacetylase family protein [Tistrella mobilis]|uniref:divergent polysaccharide deacetylase family protein n=1 Tax=Tistrella mobilis TaxID=171437 RepID=UPI003556DCC6